MKVDGLSFYKCDLGCEYYFAVEFPDFPDDSLPVCCPICRSESISFVKDIEQKFN